MGSSRETFNKTLALLSRSMELDLDSVPKVDYLLAETCTHDALRKTIEGDVCAWCGAPIESEE